MPVAEPCWACRHHVPSNSRSLVLVRTGAPLHILHLSDASGIFLYTLIALESWVFFQRPMFAKVLCRRRKKNHSISAADRVLSQETDFKHESSPSSIGKMAFNDVSMTRSCGVQAAPPPGGSTRPISTHSQRYKRCLSCIAFTSQSTGLHPFKILRGRGPEGEGGRGRGKHRVRTPAAGLGHRSADEVTSRVFALSADQPSFRT